MQCKLHYMVNYVTLASRRTNTLIQFHIYYYYFKIASSGKFNIYFNMTKKVSSCTQANPLLENGKRNPLPKKPRGNHYHLIIKKNHFT